MPSKRLLLLFLIFSVVLILLTRFNLSWPTFFILNGLLFLLSLGDLFLSPSKKQVQFKRTIPVEMERGISYHAAIHSNNNSTKRMLYHVVDGTPQSFDKLPIISGNVGEQASTVVHYDVTAKIRGKYEVNHLYVRYKSYIGLWEKQMKIEDRQEVKVIPDLTSMKGYLESAQQFLLHDGLKVRKHKTGSGEFTKIRSFVVGDDPRKINWRQTAKLQEVMTNEFEPEHGKYITILLDCGRMMGAELSNSNRLEKTLEAALTVAAAALQKGDYVSVLAFSKEVKVYVPPAKGMAHIQTILQAIYQVEVDASESNYAAVLAYLQTVQKKRSFLILFSDIYTFLHEESALVYLKRLRKRHLFLMLGIEDESLQKESRNESISIKKAMMKSIAQQQILMKRTEKIRWEKQGLHMVEAKEESLAGTAVSYYITMLNQGVL
ncbi:hypothetical protein A9C19_04190 [Bacillus weihaiensis]|uniref:VWFA domain-containing protein n=1 Tax=Bacillus weihaiensis TaxID=1547283 RepID=A0A1L3MX96_9BACI|nr:hypothetical protein A9C19_04190 [Bacillus weihaiensis]